MTIELGGLAGPLLTIAISLVTVGITYGALNTRLRAVEQGLLNAITRAEFNGLEVRMGQVVDELRGMRSELLAVVRDANRPH